MCRIIIVVLIPPVFHYGTFLDKDWVVNIFNYFVVVFVDVVDDVNVDCKGVMIRICHY